MAEGNATVNTVTGPITPDELGLTLMHEHFAFGYPGFQGDLTMSPHTRESILQTGIDVAEKAKSRGVKTIVDATPNDCGRDVLLLREISERTGVQVICSTGYYYEAEGAPAYFKFRQGLGTAEEEVLELMMTEITEGIEGTGIKPGVIKLASSKDEITPYEQIFFRCGAKAQRETGTPIITHTQEGTMAPQQAELLLSEGANPGRVMIGHMDGNTDIAYHVATLEQGVNIAFDRFGVQGIVGMPMDSMRLGVLTGLLGLGYDEQLLLSHDTVNVWLGRPPVLPDAVAEILGGWHITHVFDDILPELEKAGVPRERLDALFTRNPKKVFSA
jgi:phosphotriesterase-related protein